MARRMGFEPPAMLEVKEVLLKLKNGKTITIIPHAVKDMEKKGFLRMVYITVNEWYEPGETPKR